MDQFGSRGWIGGMKGDQHTLIHIWNSMSVSFLVDKSTGLSIVPGTGDELLCLVSESGSSDLKHSGFNP